MRFSSGVSVLAETRQERHILRSWNGNAAAWTEAVRSGAIDSRVQVTDHAVVAAVLDRAPRSVLDMGCGEGWLVRALAAHGVQLLGVDGVPELVARARAAGGGRFQQMDYQEVAAGALHAAVDVVVCNFSLLGGTLVADLLRALPAVLNSGGALVIQTLHPREPCGELPYRDGWRAGSWCGFGAAFSDPAPWYFRTLESWSALLRATGWRLRAVQEPIHPQTGRPLSVLFVAEPAAACVAG